jgi:ribonuclease Z
MFTVTLHPQRSNRRKEKGSLQAAQIANQAQVKLLVFYHLLQAPDGYLARSVFARGIDEVRRGNWTIADDGSLYTLPIGTDVIRIGSVVE